MDRHGSAPKLVVSDVDGTLITEEERVPDRVVDAIRRAGEASTYFTIATGRPARWVLQVLEQVNVLPIVVCSNGAVLYDSKTDHVIEAHTLAPEVLRAVTAQAHEATAPFGGISVAVERSGKSAFDRINELFVATPSYIPDWASDEHGVESEKAALSHPATKLLIRSDLLNSAQLFDIIAPTIEESVAHVTFSMPDGLLEVTAPGVTKALGVASLAEHLGVDQDDVLCFGDMPNDCEMLTWAGRGVAVDNASKEVKAVANHTTRSNQEGGIADVLEWWF